MIFFFLIRYAVALNKPAYYNILELEIEHLLLRNGRGLSSTKDDSLEFISNENSSCDLLSTYIDRRWSHWFSSFTKKLWYKDNHNIFEIIIPTHPQIFVLVANVLANPFTIRKENTNKQLKATSFFQIIMMDILFPNPLSPNNNNMETFKNPGKRVLSRNCYKFWPSILRSLTWYNNGRKSGRCFATTC